MKCYMIFTTHFLSMGHLTEFNLFLNFFSVHFKKSSSRSGFGVPPMYTEVLPGGQTLALIIPSLTETMAGRYYCSASYANTELLEQSVDIQTYGEFCHSNFSIQKCCFQWIIKILRFIRTNSCNYMEKCTRKSVPDRWKKWYYTMRSVS